MLILVVLLLISIDAASRHGSAAAGVGLKASVWKPICQLSEELDAVPAGAAHTIQQTLSHVKTMQLGSLRAAVYAAKHAGTSKALQGTLMQDYFERRRTAAETAVQTSIADGAIKAAATSAYLKGRIDEYMNLLANTKDTTNNACLLNTDTNGAAATKAADTLGGEACKLRQTQRQAAKHTAQKLTSTGIRDLVFGQGSGNNHQPAASGQQKCKLLSGHHTEGIASTGPLEADFYVMGGYMKIKQSSTPQIDLTPATDLKTGNSGQATAWQQAIEAVAAVQGDNNQATTNETGNLHTFPTLKTVVANLKNKPADDASSKHEDYVKENFGGDDSKKLQTYEEAVNKEEIPAGVAGITTATTLGNIDEPEKLSALRTYYQNQAYQTIQELRAQLEAAKTTQNPKAAAEEKEKECTAAGASEDKCKALEAKGCTFNTDSKKCELKKEVKAEIEKKNENEGKEEKPTSECKDKPQKDCTGNCKWENNACKDSSILLNKQFALTVVSAAFAALLF